MEITGVRRSLFSKNTEYFYRQICVCVIAMKEECVWFSVLKSFLYFLHEAFYSPSLIQNFFFNLDFSKAMSQAGTSHFQEAIRQELEYSMKVELDKILGTAPQNELEVGIKYSF